MSNKKNINSIESLDFNKLQSIMNKLIDLRKIKDIFSLEADYTFDWQEDINETTKNINTLVNQTINFLSKEDYLSAHYTLTFLKIYFQNFNSAVNGITNDLIMFYEDSEEFYWPEIPENYSLPSQECNLDEK